MERHELINETLKPIDKVFDLSLTALRKADLYEPFKNVLHFGMKQALLTQFKLNNHLRVYGQENVPKEGGVLYAMNHQSWLDVQVLSAASPRKVSFLAKSDFMNWPFLHQLIDLTDSVFIRRGGDDETLEMIAARLREGLCIGIFPEGTIPGEEDIPRWEVEPETGLLRGKTGVVRLAMLSGAPIVPVGLSGTGKAFPPEAYPRLQQLPLVGRAPIVVRFGEPLYLKRRSAGKITYEQLRGMTDRVMRAISAQVDHSMGYVPMSVPVTKKEAPGPLPPIPFRNARREKKARVGVLVLHGFTSHVSCVSDVRFALDEKGIPYRIPILRGHGGNWQDLAGIKASDWYDDAENAMLDLLTECRRVIVVGLSMGGLVALNLAARYRKQVIGLVTLAAALRFKDPLAFLSPALAKVVRSWPSPKAFHDKALAEQRNRNYPKFPTKAFVELYRYAKETEHNLSFVAAEALILHSRKDQIVRPCAAQIIHDKISSAAKRIVWFEKSGHEMLLDMEALQVLGTVNEFIERVAASQAADADDEE